MSDANFNCIYCGNGLEQKSLRCKGCGRDFKHRLHKCPECGYQTIDGDKFCLRCGMDIPKNITLKFMGNEEKQKRPAVGNTPPNETISRGIDLPRLPAASKTKNVPASKKSEANGSPLYHDIGRPSEIWDVLRAPAHKKAKPKPARRGKKIAVAAVLILLLLGLAGFFAYLNWDALAGMLPFM